MDIFGKKKIRVLENRMNLMQSSLKTAFGKVKEDMININSWLNYYYEHNKKLQNTLINVQNSADSASKKARSCEEYARRTSSYLSEREEVFRHFEDQHRHDISHLKENLSQTMIDLSHLRSEQNLFAHKNEINFHIENISREVHMIDSTLESFSSIPESLGQLKKQVQDHLSSPHTDPEVDKRIDEIQERLKSILVKKTPKEKLVQKVTKNSHDYIKAMVLSYIRKYEKISGYQLREMIVEEQNITSKSTLYRILEEIEESDEVSTIRQGKEKIFLFKLKKTQ